MLGSLAPRAECTSLLSEQEDAMRKRERTHKEVLEAPLLHTSGLTVFLLVFRLDPQSQSPSKYNRDVLPSI